MANKVKFGLNNVHIAPISSVSSSYSYGNVFAIPGAVSLTLDPAGDENDFYADDIKYFTSYANQGYTGTLEMALLNDDFREKILNEAVDSNGAHIEKADLDTNGFALGFQIQGDVSGRRYWYYNCKAARPNNSATTKEASITPQTESVSITAAPRSTDSKVRVFIDKTDDNTNVYNDFFNSVYESSISG